MSMMNYRIVFQKKGEALFKKVICDNDVKVLRDNDKWGLYVSNLKGKTKCNLYFYEGQTVFNFDYAGAEQTFTVPISETYKLDTWGAQGATDSETYYGGYDEGESSSNSGSGGGGYYGGGASWGGSGAGGSGYIGNSLLTNKAMYCYKCSESSEENTKTIATSCNSVTPVSYCAKRENGYAKITLISIDA